MVRKGKRPKAGREKSPGRKRGPGHTKIPEAEKDSGRDGGASPEAEASKQALTWVLRRLNVLEYLILFLAGILALVGGALVGWLVSSSSGLSFRWSWAIGSLLLFILPGGFVYLREFRERGPSPDRDVKSEPKEPHG